MAIQQLLGTYNITGTNQNEESSAYKGILTLSLDENHRIQAEWLINNNQKQSGNGFFKDNILVINFNYKGENETVFKGVVVYKCLTKDILEGFWSEKHGNPLYLGEETCFRIGTHKEVVN
ncbi:hypothetical protein [Psychroserpens luteus]|uniref:Uncharacterized protein n=1 Tax=Psychroserpens luteus TaxID=1434066 RepID=A0ABW5ZQR1_9FLAO|nr:hypothetical protein [Psychroserpens luteus]